MSQSNSIINAVKRLERIGDETSKTNQKLFDAVQEVCEFILTQADEVGIDGDEELASGYVLRRNGGYRWIEVKHRDGWCHVGGDAEDEDGRWLDRETDFDPNTQVAREFARAVASGLLTEIAAKLEREAPRNATLADDLRRELPAKSQV